MERGEPGTAAAIRSSSPRRLRSRYLVLDLRTPLVASASPLTGQPRDRGDRLPHQGLRDLVLMGIAGFPMMRTVPLNLKRRAEGLTEQRRESST
jgi:hypothetical protein